MGNTDEQYIDNSLIVSPEALIQPWASLKKKLEYMMSLSTNAGTKKIRSITSVGQDESDEERPTSYQLSIPYGFQLMESIDHPSVNSSITSMLCMPGMRNQFAAMDANHVHLWSESNHILKLPVKKPRNDEKGSVVMAISQWEYAPKWRVIIIATSLLELKTFTSDFHLTGVKSSIKPVLNLNFIEETEEIVVSGVGNIQIWKFVQQKSTFLLDSPRLCISDLNIDDWVTISVYVKCGQIYASYDNNVNLYDYKNGEKLDTMRHIHDGTITAMVFDEDNQYLITGSRDGDLKIWNRKKNLIFELNGHFQTITGLLLNPFSISVSRTSKLSPLLLSSSLDGSVRQWSLDSGICNYILETGSECMGIKWLKGEHFATFSTAKLSIWDINHYYWTFSFLNMPVIYMKRYKKSKSARILVVTQDFSIRLICPVSGSVLYLAFPPISDNSLKKVVYDIVGEEIFALLNDGSIIIISTSTNPGTVICEIHSEMKEKLTVIEEASIIEDESDKPFVLFGGNDAGQIVTVEKSLAIRYSFCIQGHNASIIDLKYSDYRSTLFSLSSDNVLKIWKVQFRGLDIIDECNLLNPLKSINLICSFESPLTFIDQMAIDSIKQVIAVVSENSEINMFSYDTVIQKIEKKSKDDDHQNLTSIACLEKLNIFATCGTERTVKIWDGADNSLIRELNFGSPIYSVCFANERGDLMVGLMDQIAVVRIQDFLPDLILLRLLAYKHITDDEEELPANFDETVDFWHIYRKSITKSHQIRNLLSESDQILKEDSCITSEIALSQNLFSEDSLAIDNSTITDITDRNPYRHSDLQPNEKHINGRYNNFNQIETELTSREQVMEAFKLENLPTLDRAEFKSKIYVPKEVGDEFLSKLAKQRSSVLRFVKSVEPLEPTKISMRVMKAKTAGTRRNSKALANSVVTSDLRDVESQNIFNFGNQRRKSKSAPVTALQYPRRVSLAKIPEFLLNYSDGSSDHSVKTKSRAKEKKGEASKSKKPKKSKKQKIKKEKGSKGNEIDENIELEHDADTEVSIEQDTKDAIPVQSEPVEITKVKSPINDKKSIKKNIKVLQSNTESKIEAMEDQPKITTIKAAKLIQKTEANVEKGPEIVYETIHEIIKESVQESVQETNNEISYCFDTSSPISTRSSVPVKRNLTVEEKAEMAKVFLRSEKEDKMKNLNNKEKSKKDAPQRDQSFNLPVYKKPPAFVLKKRQPTVRYFSSVQSKTKADETDDNFEISDADEIKEEIHKMLPPMKFRGSRRESWTLFNRNRYDSDLNSMFDKSWFPGIPGHLPTTVENLLKAIVDTIIKGDTWVKMEGIKALADVYHTFREDLVDPIQSIFIPQFELLENENSEVRLSVLNSFISCDIGNNQVIAAIIPRLADSNNMVRSSAMVFLQKRGINSKSQLTKLMEDLNLLKAVNPPEKYVSILDKLYLQTITTNHGKNFDQILKWLGKVPKLSTNISQERPKSSHVTLVFSAKDLEYQSSQIAVKTKAIILQPISIKPARFRVSRLSKS